MRFTTHLMFGGRCEEAFRFYERLFGGTLQTMLRYGDSPLAAGVDAAMHDKILHATLRTADGELTGADVAVDQYQPPQGFSVLLDVSGFTRGEQIFAALAVDGSVRMPFQKTFWSPGFGVVVDRFGVPWEVNCHEPQPG